MRIIFWYSICLSVYTLHFCPFQSGTPTAGESCPSLFRFSFICPWSPRSWSIQNLGYLAPLTEVPHPFLNRPLAAGIPFLTAFCFPSFSSWALPYQGEWRHVPRLWRPGLPSIQTQPCFMLCFLTAELCRVSRDLGQVDLPWTPHQTTFLSLPEYANKNYSRRATFRSSLPGLLRENLLY